MIRLSRLADYGIVVMTHMARHPDRQHAAPEIAAQTRLPLPTASKILKSLARAGLLEGHECTTHHSLLDTLVRLAPTARVRDIRLFVEDRERLTSAGVTAGIDLMLAIVAREAGHATALAVARNLVVYLRRAGADPQLDTPRERCWVYRELAAWSRGFSRERYDALAGCAEFPFDAFPW